MSISVLRISTVVNNFIMKYVFEEKLKNGTNCKLYQAFIKKGIA